MLEQPIIISPSLGFTSSDTEQFVSNHGLHHIYFYQIDYLFVKKILRIILRQTKQGLYRTNSVQAPI